MDRLKVVEVMNVSKVYENASGRMKVLDHIDLTVYKGEFLGILGDSGSGKTTLLNLIGGMDSVSEGNISVSGVSVTQLNDKQKTMYRRNHVGFIFQDYNLINELTTYENIIMPLQLKGNDIDEKLINQLMEKFRLKEKKNQYPMKLSGGEQQRVAIIRSLVADQDIILADEPTGNLDSKNSVVVVELLRYLSKSAGKTILFVTHNIALVKWCNRVIQIKDGKIIDNDRVNFLTDMNEHERKK